MTDIDFCTGKNCPKNKICQRFTNYLYKLDKKQDVRYARDGNPVGECEQFEHKLFVGN